jgi:hypothetical protein
VKIDQNIEKNPTEVTHPVLKLDLLEDKPKGLLQISEDCVDILEAILNHHTKANHYYDRVSTRTNQTS